MAQGSENPNLISLDGLRRALRDRLHLLSPQVLRAAIFVLENPARVAFSSVRGLADEAGVNPATIVRLAKIAGFETFKPFRDVFREAVGSNEVHYGERAAALLGPTNAAEPDLAIRIGETAIGNIGTLFQPETRQTIRDAARALVGARRIFVAGFRSSYALAYYFAYAGRMAFPGIRLAQASGLPISDELAEMETGDALFIVTFSPYSQEALKATELARTLGVTVVIVSDSFTAPVTRGAGHVIEVPMAGPQYLPSLVAGTAACEALLAEMVQIAGDPAITAIEAFEKRVRAVGSYTE